MLALMAMPGCGIVNDEPKKPDKNAKRSKAKVDCAGSECRVRITCRSGRRHVLIGPGPVSVRTTTTALRTTLTVDFAGSRDDKLIRC
ncbi:MAG: hypothetical protein LC708_01885 [Actinobacteria bacterium]|nr:hypothetical protein [Actinomycetota bacterium]